MPFAKGQSGNPGGRPKALKAIQEAARDHTAEALATLARICGDTTAPPAAQVAEAIEASGTLTLEKLVLTSMIPQWHSYPCNHFFTRDAT